MGGFDTRLDDLDRLATTLHQGAIQLDGPTGTAQAPPDAGQSSGELAGALEEISAAVVALRQDLDQMATNVRTSSGQYQDTEVDTANKLSRQLDSGR